MTVPKVFLCRSSILQEKDHSGQNLQGNSFVHSLTLFRVQLLRMLGFVFARVMGTAIPKAAPLTTQRASSKEGDVIMPLHDPNELPVICISHVSALRYFMSSRNDSRLCWPVAPFELAMQTALRLPPPNAPSARTLSLASEQFGMGFDELHFLVADNTQRRRLRGAVPHSCNVALPASAFWQIDADGIQAFVTSPDLTFCQLAAGANELDAIAAGNALCSDYRFEPAALGGVVNRHDSGEGPWTSPGNLKAFVTQHSELHGSRRALNAVKYVYAHARSPKESGIALACGLPYRLGGYALGRVQMNPSVSIFAGVNQYERRVYQERIPDIIVVSKGTDGLPHTTGIDYDPWSTHGSRERIASDIMRRNQIASAGLFTHITLTTEQIMNYALFSTGMDEIRRSLRVRKGPRFGRAVTDVERRHRELKAEGLHYSLWEKAVRSSKVYGG